MSGASELVQLEESGAVAVLRLASPPVNALSQQVIAQLGSALDRVEAGAARCLVVASALPGAFAAGADLKHLVAVDGAGFGAYLTALRAVIERIPRLGMLSIAALDGHALGGGLELALACSMRVAARGARLGVPEIRLGLIPGAGGTQRLTRLVSRRDALELLLRGRAIDAAAAHAMGLVDRLVEAGQAETEARALAGELASGPREAQCAILECLAAADGPLELGLALEGEAVRRLFDSEDAREGIAAFLAKRPARFR